MALVTNWTKVRATNSTDGSFPSRIPTITKPTGAGVIDFSARSSGADTMQLLIYGTGADDTTVNVRVIGWRAVGALWIPTTLTEVDATLGTAIGIAAQPVINTERFADTLALAGAGINSDSSVVSPADNTVASMLLDLKGSSLVEVLFDMGTATNANALYAVL